jgi:hypothetical protein
LGKFSAFWLVLLFIIITPWTVWTFNLQHRALQEDTYLIPLDQQNAYENLTPFILPAIAESTRGTPGQEAAKIGELEFISVVENLQLDDWELIAREVITADYVQAETEKNLPLFLDYMAGREARLEVEFNTQILRENLLSPAGDRMVNLIFNSWQACTPAGEEHIRRFLAGESSFFPYCKPADASRQREIFNLLKDSKNVLAESIPDRWNAREQYAQQNDTTLVQADAAFYRDLQRPIVMGNELAPINWLVSLSILCLIVMLGVDSGRSFLRWVGLPLIFTGVFSLLPLAFIPFLLSFEPASDPTIQINDIQSEAWRGVILSLVTTFSTPVLTRGATLVGLGFFMLLISALIHPEEEEEKEPYTAQNQAMDWGATPTGSWGSTPPSTPSQPRGSSATIVGPPSSTLGPTIPPAPPMPKTPPLPPLAPSISGQSTAMPSQSSEPVAGGTEVRRTRLSINVEPGEATPPPDKQA